MESHNATFPKTGFALRLDLYFSMDRSAAPTNFRSGVVAPAFEQQLSASGNFAMSEATKYFGDKGSVHETRTADFAASR